ncbi:hypothetical protein AXX17_AT5G20190 [Arabidopsis thaliana]|uniref:Retrotransposon gag domain-containing protein n=1 Tax=Arabidopsis thaliana TaxID=3702 RepID=A0A178UE96_ARATH|nr:hypothetical protein AXX17_AT5G20190 [Arabidopsis thaliana]
MTTSRIESRLIAIEKYHKALHEEFIGFHKRQKEIQDAILEFTRMVSASKSSHSKQESATVLEEDIEMPSFDGDHLCIWLEIIEVYFTLQLAPEVCKVDTAFRSMEGDALLWLQCLRQENPTLTWSQLKTELIEEFGGGDITASPEEQLASLRQTGSVDEYANEFRARAAQIGNKDQLVKGMFLNGLKEEIRVMFRPNDAEGPEMAIRTAKAIERELNFNNRAKGRRQYSSHQEYFDMEGTGLCYPGYQPYSIFDDF